MRYFELFETRRNPNHPSQQKEKLYKTLSAYGEGFYVHFSNVLKIGINPQQKYTSNPNGIYAYPLPFVIENIFGGSWAYQSTSPYVSVLKIADGMKIFDVYADSIKNEDVDFIKRLQQSAGLSDDDLLTVSNNYDLYTNVKTLAKYGNSKNYSFNMNSIIRKMGYDIILETDSKRFKESPQIIFLHRNAFEVLETLLNRKGVTVGRNRIDTELSGMTAEMAVKGDPRMIGAIKNPNLRTQMYAVEYNPYYVFDIENPAREVIEYFEKSIQIDYEKAIHKMKELGLPISRYNAQNYL